MIVYMPKDEYQVDLVQLADDLLRENLRLVTLSRTGELVIDDASIGVNYTSRREVWQMREEGEGCNNTVWAGHEFEFCRSVPAH